MDKICKKAIGKRHALCIVMPVYNEQDVISAVLEKWDSALSKLGIDYEIRPYDDGSKDNSLSVIQETAKRLGPQINVRTKPNGGHGNTILMGYREAARDGFEWVFQVDSDDEMKPESFNELWSKRDKYDYLVGIRDGRIQTVVRKIISLFSRLCVRAFFGNGIWDVNVPYRLMRVSAFKDFYQQIPLTTFAPNVILSGLAARHHLRSFETRVPQHIRTTGEVSIKKWKLLSVSMKSFFQVASFSMRAPDIEKKEEDQSFFFKVGIFWLLATTGFAWLPDTFVNWGYDYLSFLPLWFSVALFFACVLILKGPLDRLLPGLGRCPMSIICTRILLLFLMPLLFWVFRTKVHCFCGDGCVGTVPSGTELHLRDFVPPFPGKGRLDCWGIGPLTKLLMRHGVLLEFTGMPVRFAAQIYTVIFGGVYVALTLSLFRRSTAAICAFLTLPCAFNFFGNLDCYSFSLCMVVAFAAALAACDTMGERVDIRHLSLATLLWLVGMWTHPFFVFGAFPLIPHVLRFFSRHSPHIRFSLVFNAAVVQLLFAASLFVAICLSVYAKPFFIWSQGGRPPLFSADTLIHLLNVLLLPGAPLAFVVLSGSDDRRDKVATASTFLLMCLCFLPLGLTQGANDQFPYMFLSLLIMLPWVLHVAKHAPSRSACRFILALNLYLLIPMVAVHSTDRSIVRAEALYPRDPCKHNREMSWQTHLGLILGDNIIDSQAVKSATLRTFLDGARHAEPSAFRGGNYIYHTAFLYHFGEFEKGRRQLFELLGHNPEAIRYFLSVRPAFIYCNRKRLWDDIDLFLVQQKSPFLNKYREIAQALRKQAMDEPFYLKRPSYATTDY